MVTRFFSALLIMLFGAATGFALEKEIDLASIDKNTRQEIYTRAIAPTVLEKYEYYEIRGHDEKELRRQMSRNGTKWGDGKTYDALTSWSWKWDYGYDRTAQGCSVDSFKTTVDIVFRYPKWERADDAPQTLAEKWDRYMKNLILHENGHRDMAVQAAEEFSRAVLEMPPADSCSDLDQQVRSLSRERMAKLNESSKVYDAETVHGSTQGAVFP